MLLSIVGNCFCWSFFTRRYRSCLWFWVFVPLYTVMPNLMFLVLNLISSRMGVCLITCLIYNSCLHLAIILFFQPHLCKGKTKWKIINVLHLVMYIVLKVRWVWINLDLSWTVSIHLRLSQLCGRVFSFFNGNSVEVLCGKSKNWSLFSSQFHVMEDMEGFWCPALILKVHNHF